MGPTERAWTTGLVALANSEFYVVGSEYTFKFDGTA